MSSIGELMNLANYTRHDTACATNLLASIVLLDIGTK